MTSDAGGSGQSRTHTAASVWSPFRHRVYAVIWTAAVVADTGSWMYNAASGWLMTGLNASPVVVFLVQVASSLPMFLFALPAGALADIVDKRRLLIVFEVATTAVAAIFAAMVWFDLVTPVFLLIFMFLIGAGGALTAPAWQAIVPQLVPTRDLPSAVAANSVGVNVSRAVGPALGGLLTALLGIAAIFSNAASNFAAVGALSWWRAPRVAAQRLPADRFVSAIRVGLRHAGNNPPLFATLMRSIGIFLFASAYWALLPLIARSQIAGGPELYGMLLGAIGVGAVGGAFVLPRLKAKIGADGIVSAGTAGTAVALILFGLAREPLLALLASTIAGVSWIAVVAALNVSAQVALPDWVRGRGLAMFVSVVYGAMTLGSVAWGYVAGKFGLPMAHFIAAGGALLVIPLTWRWKLRTGLEIDLTPSMHWPTPVLAQDIENDRGPVLVVVEYRPVSDHRAKFLNALSRLERERRRDGAYAWGIFEDVEEPGRFLETFLVESWLEHLHQHERVTNADRVLQEHVHRLLKDTPKVAHLIAAEARSHMSTNKPA
jgi:MFS family permease